MGGVNGFNGGAHSATGGMNLDDGHSESAFKKSEMPTQKESSPLPENDKEVLSSLLRF